MIGEKVLERKLKYCTEKRHGLCIKFWCVSFTGFPDRMALLPGGRVYFIETKSTGDKRSKRQIFVHDQLKKLGFQVWTIDDNEGLFELLNHMNS